MMMICLSDAGKRYNREWIFRHFNYNFESGQSYAITGPEFLDFHQGFKSFIPGMSSDKAISIIGLEKARNKQIRYFSSGMKQRIKLAQCVFSDTAIVLLDEPCTNLDKEGIDMYHSLVTDYCNDRLLIVSSNDEVEYKFCNHLINISNYKIR